MEYVKTHEEGLWDKAHKFCKVSGLILKNYALLLFDFSRTKHFFTNLYILSLLPKEFSLGEKLREYERLSKKKWLEAPSAPPLSQTPEVQHTPLASTPHFTPHTLMAPHKSLEEILSKGALTKFIKNERHWQYQITLAKLINALSPKSLAILGDFSFQDLQTVILSLPEDFQTLIIEEEKVSLSSLKRRNFQLQIFRSQSPIPNAEVLLIITGTGAKRFSQSVERALKMKTPQSVFIFKSSETYFPQTLSFHPDVLGKLNELTSSLHLVKVTDAPLLVSSPLSKEM